MPKSSSSEDDGTGRKKGKGPNQKAKHRGDLETNEARLLLFVKSNERYAEFRNIFDKLENKETIIKEMSEISEDFNESEFFTVNISNAEEVQGTLETAA